MVCHRVGPGGRAVVACRVCAPASARPGSTHPRRRPSSSTTTAHRPSAASTTARALSIVVPGREHRWGVQICDLDGRDRQAAQSPVGTDEIGDEGGRGTPQHLGRGVVLLEHTPLAQHRYAVAEHHRLVDVVSDEDHRLVQVGLEAQELLLQPFAGDRVHGAEWLVHQEHRWVSRKRTGHSHPLGLAARQLVGVATRRTGPGPTPRARAARRPWPGYAPCPSREGVAPRPRCRPRSGAGTVPPAGSRIPSAGEAPPRPSRPRRGHRPERGPRWAPPGD